MGTEWTEDLIRKRLIAKPRRNKRRTEPSKTLWGYREAAAVRSNFDPEWLRPSAGIRANRTALERMLRDCSVVYDENGESYWALIEATRRDALERLGSRSAMLNALKPNARHPGDTLQGIINAYLKGTAPSVEKQSVVQLSATLQFLEWFSEFIPDLPDPDYVKLRIDAELLLEPLRSLVHHFSNREEELSQLRNYVGVAPPDSMLESVSRRLRQVMSFQEQPPLLLYGPGGVGKSTLIAKFILDHATLRRQQSFPFAYLNFERSALRVDRPITLLRELARQFALLYPENRSRVQALTSDWEHRVRSFREELSYASLVGKTQDESDDLSLMDRITGRSESGPSPEYAPVLEFVDEFVELVADSVDCEAQPFLLVLDTFEEVQYRNLAELNNLYNVMERFQSGLPGLRTVIAGRAPVARFKTEQLELKELPHEPAIALATQLLRQVNPEWDYLAEELVEQIGGSPLSIRLAVDLVAKEGSAGALKDVRTKNFLLFRVGEGLIQGQLQRRILEHIHHPEVRKLARFGVVLRRITPVLIDKVLAGPSGIETIDPQHSQMLFDELARETSLVQVDESNASLAYRNAIRPTIHGLVTKADPEVVEQIHKRAVRFFKESAQADDRIEELYHRLAIGQSSRTLDERWISGAEAKLAGSFEELSSQGKAYLLSKLGTQASELGVRLSADEEDEILKAGDSESWARSAARRIEPLLKHEGWKEVLEILKQRPERGSDGTLSLYEAKSLAGLKKRREARGVVADAISAASRAGNRTVLLTALTLSARLDERSKKRDTALRSLNEAVVISRGLSDPLERLPIELERLKLLRRGPSEDDNRIIEAMGELATDLAELKTWQFRTNATLVRDAAHELTAEYSGLTDRVFDKLSTL